MRIIRYGCNDEGFRVGPASAIDGRKSAKVEAMRTSSGGAPVSERKARRRGRSGNVICPVSAEAVAVCKLILSNRARALRQGNCWDGVIIVSSMN